MRTLDRQTGSPVRSWALSALFGVVAPLFTSLGLLIAILAIGTIVAIAVRHAGLLGLSGVLTGFGACWTVLVLRIPATGGSLDNLAFWLAVGLVPLVVGLAALALTASPRPGGLPPPDSRR